MKKVIYVLIIFIFVFSCIEIFCRIFNIGKTYSDERNTLYQYDNYLGWMPIPNITATISNSTQQREYKHNSLGFRDIEHDYNNKTKKRIMFIGDSFCYGYGVSQNEVFTELLRNKLLDFELFNCGVSGYGSDQEYLLLEKYYTIIKPDIIFLLFCDNDMLDNTLNNNYNGYYKPYIIKQQDNLILKGTPVPKSWLYYRYNFFVKYSRFNNFMLETFIRIKNPSLSLKNYEITGDIYNEIIKFCNLCNCQLIICIAKDDENNFKQILKDNNLFFLNLENNNVRSTTDLHWNKKGHEYVADKIYNFLKEENIIN